MAINLSLEKGDTETKHVYDINLIELLYSLFFIEIEKKKFCLDRSMVIMEKWLNFGKLNFIIQRLFESKTLKSSGYKIKILSNFIIFPSEQLIFC